MNKTIDEYMSLGYTIFIAPYEDDNEIGYMGRIVEIPAIEVYSNSPEEVLEDIDDLKREWFMQAIEDGINIPLPKKQEESEYSGRITLRLAKSMHKFLSERAEQEGISLNFYINTCIQSGIYIDDMNEAYYRSSKLHQDYQSMLLIYDNQGNKNIYSTNKYTMLDVNKPYII